MRTEKTFSNFVFHELKGLHDIDNVDIDEGKNILTDITCIYEKNRFQLIHGFSQTDIAFFMNVNVEVARNFPALIKFYGDSNIQKGSFAIPFVVLELKCGDVTTDNIRSRDFVASRIREIFPFSAYFLIAENTKKEEKTLFRQGKSFTNFFISKDEFTKNQIHQIFNNYIKPHIKNIISQLKIASID